MTKKRNTPNMISCPMTKRSEKTELYNVVRVIATILVVFGHATYTSWAGDSGEIAMITEGAGTVYYNWQRTIGNIGGWAYGFHMPLFFMLSGALYTYSKKITSFDLLLAGKIKRLIIPFYIVGIFYMFPIKLIANFYNVNTFISAFQGFLFGGNSGHLWFLLSLFWCFVLFYPVYKYILTKSLWLGIIITVILYYCNITGVFSNSLLINQIPGLSSSFSYMPYFMGGFFFEEVRKKHSLKLSQIFLIAIVLIILSYFQFTKGLFSNNVITAVLGSFTIIIFSDLISRLKCVPNSKVFKLLLRNSMYIYLFHDPLNFLILRWGINQNIINHDTLSRLFFLGRTIGVIIVSIALGELIRASINKMHKNATTDSRERII